MGRSVVNWRGETRRWTARPQPKLFELLTVSSYEIVTCMACGLELAANCPRSLSSNIASHDVARLVQPRWDKARSLSGRAGYPGEKHAQAPGIAAPRPRRGSARARDRRCPPATA